jgi:hypothetical protein
LLGVQMASALAAEAQHRAAGHGPSPLAGVEYQSSRGELDLFRFVPSAVDDTVFRFLKSCQGLGPGDRAAIRAALTMKDFYTLLTFARRRALSTLRENDAGLVTAGIDAVTMIDAERIDWRDAVVATALLTYAGGRTGMDVVPALTTAAAATEQGIAEILIQFVDEPVDSLDDEGYRELSTGSGVVLVSDGGDPFAPTTDLVSAALSIADVFDGDVWRVSDVEVASDLPRGWLASGDQAVVDWALGSIVACVTVDGQLAATVSPEAAHQQLTVWLAECSDPHAAATIAAIAGPGRRASFEVLSVAVGRLCVVMISRSVMVGVEAYERAGSLERFRPRLSALLAGCSQ